MTISITLEPQNGQTRFVPLAVYGYCLTRSHFLEPVWQTIDFDTKVYVHQPREKLQDILVSILAGNQSIGQINSHLRPDLALASAWGRQRFAEQSTLARLLDRLTDTQLDRLRQGIQSLFRAHAQTMEHDFQREPLLLDIDPTYVPASRHAQGSEKCYAVGKKNQYGRQWNRISAPAYHETLCSFLYPGNTQGCDMLKRSVQAVEDLLGYSKAQRNRIIIRSDASIGTDANINWLLWGGYEVLMKGFSGQRAIRLAKQVSAEDWIFDQERKRWIALAPHPPRFCRRIRTFVLRWESQSGFRFGTLLSTLNLLPEVALHVHDGRGAVEVEIKDDKQGLLVTHRRKHSWQAQIGLILLTDLAHNLMTWFHHWVLETSPFADFGTKRIVADLMCMPGRIEQDGSQITKVALCQEHPYAENMRIVLENLLKFFEIP